MSSNPKTILVADDDASIRFVLETALGQAGFNVESFNNGKDLLNRATHGQGDLVITDIVMPGGSGLDLLKTIKTLRPELPVIVITAQSTLRNAVGAFERGAFEYLSKPFDIVKIVELVGLALEGNSSPSPKRGVDIDRFGGIIGSSRAMQELFRTIGRLANSEMTVLIHGESGTGKELVARAVHAHSPRRQGPFTAINMAAIPKNLVESELFGHEKGAFTGAISRRTGHFERTREGTLFLDEIGDMPMEAQTRLLRVLQNGTFTRIGGTETISANVRIIAATHQDLLLAISHGRFREDLFYRLNVIPLSVPSLRSRPDDIPLLCDYFFAQVAKKINIPPKCFTPEALVALQSYGWPGNVRELENLVQRLMILAPHDTIGPDRLDFIGSDGGDDLASSAHPPIVAPLAATCATSGPSLEDGVIALVDRHFATTGSMNITNLHDLILRKVEMALFERVLRETRGNRIKAARILGINRNTLRKKCTDLGLD
ncbi:MAG: ntrC [Magnetococcales bacterium]|nr:ntrC [Magnetococcales bacterium]HIJ83113.1 nitrogen regulation protein NR(I) [Magnetococcales bacterium]